jgi:hypothetical protein
LPFHVNTGHFYVVASYFYVKNNKNGRYYIAIMVTRTRHNITLYVSRLSCVYRLSFSVSRTDFRDAKQMESKCRSSNVSFVTCNKKHNRITHSFRCHTVLFCVITLCSPADKDREDRDCTFFRTAGDGKWRYKSAYHTTKKLQVRI